MGNAKCAICNSLARGFAHVQLGSHAHPVRLVLRHCIIEWQPLAPKTTVTFKEEIERCLRKCWQVLKKLPPYCSHGERTPGSLRRQAHEIRW